MNATFYICKDISQSRVRLSRSVRSEDELLVGINEENERKLMPLSEEDELIGMANIEYVIMYHV